MHLSELLNPLFQQLDNDCLITGIKNDSRAMQPGDLFLAYPGALVDGRRFMLQAQQAGASAILYEEGLKKRDVLYQQLTDQQRILKREKGEALQRRENLQRQINSQSDLNWVELTLMKGLGLVPEGQQKVYFYVEGE